MWVAKKRVTQAEHWRNIQWVHFLNQVIIWLNGIISTGSAKIKEPRVIRQTSQLVLVKDFMNYLDNITKDAFSKLDMIWGLEGIMNTVHWRKEHRSEKSFRIWNTGQNLSKLRVPGINSSLPSYSVALGKLTLHVLGVKCTGSGYT